jgi:hypothetical protein
MFTERPPSWEAHVGPTLPSFRSLTRAYFISEKEFESLTASDSEDIGSWFNTLLLAEINSLESEIKRLKAQSLGIG